MKPYSLPRSTPEQQGMTSSSILSFIQGIETEQLELHSLMIVKNDHVIAEGWWEPYQRQDQHQLNSLTKSFTSTAIGLAVDEQLLSLEDQVLRFFPEHVTKEIEANMRNLKVKHLLSMATGHTQDTLPILWNNQTDWVKAFLETPIEREPGSYFLYNTGASYMLSAIIERVTGQRLLDYLRPRLLEPLGIENVNTLTCPQGIHAGGYGMKITTEDIAKFGLLYLHNGEWNGKRILSKEWVQAATAKQVSNGEPGDPSDWSQGYGYQFWRCRNDAYRGDGAFGQFCVVMPNQNAVIAMTAGLMEMQSVLDLVWEHLLPGMEQLALEANPVMYDKLIKKLSGLSYLPESAPGSSQMQWDQTGVTYSLEPNRAGYTDLSFSADEQAVKVTLADKDQESHFEVGLGSMARGTTEISGFPFQYASYGVWRKKNVLEIKLFMTEYAINDQITCHFVNDSVQVKSSRNVWMAPILSDMDVLPTLIGSRFKERDTWIGVTNKAE